MAGLIVFNAVMLLLCGAVLAGVIPLRLYGGVLRGLHMTIGITTPTESQLRWALIAWMISVIVIVDVLVLMFWYVF